MRGKTYKTVDEGSRRIEEVKAENDAGIVPPFSGTLVASNEKNHFHKTIKVRHDKVFLLDVKYLAEESITCSRQYKQFSRTFAGTVLPLQVPTQFKATQLVVAIAVWAIPGGLSITYRFYCVFNLSILLLNASEQYYITIG